MPSLSLVAVQTSPRKLLTPILIVPRAFYAQLQLALVDLVDLPDRAVVSFLSAMEAEYSLHGVV